MPTLDVLLSRGFFPWELPPPFTCQTFAAFIATNRALLPASFTSNTQVSKAAIHNLARCGTLRRKLSVPNPVSYYKLSMTVADNWPQLMLQGSRSSISLSQPTDIATGRSIGLNHQKNDLPAHKARIRSTSRYVLQADVARCYPSIYTHSIPWAMHTKAVAKANHSDNLLGNLIDKQVRNAQDQQTMGLPIGPDTSMLIGEIILDAVDVDLSVKAAQAGLQLNGFRYFDDYEFGFKGLAQAENTLSLLQEVLSQYELALNPNKTNIAPLPVLMESSAISEIRAYQFRESLIGQQTDIIHYFDRSFTLALDEPTEGVLKYAISRIGSETVHTQNWPLLENLLFQCITVEPGALYFVLNHLSAYRSNGYGVNLMNLGDVLNETILQHAPLSHGSEVAWALWGLIFFGVSIDVNVAEKASKMNDPFVSMLLLDARNRGLVSTTADFSSIQQYMTSEDLYGEQWLVAYEANVKGWLPSVSGIDHVAADVSFNLLKNGGVSFYDTSPHVTPAPQYNSPQLGDRISGHPLRVRRHF